MPSFNPPGMGHDTTTPEDHDPAPKRPPPQFPSAGHTLCYECGNKSDEVKDCNICGGSGEVPK